MTLLKSLRLLVPSVSAVALVMSPACSLFGSDGSGEPMPTPGVSGVCSMQGAEVDTASGARGDILVAVSGDRPGDVWAVGTHWGDGGRASPLAQRWDGTSWDVAALPEDRFHGMRLEDVSVVADGSAWAVGHRGKVGTSAALRWDGSAWAFDPAVPRLRNSDFLGIAGIAPDDLWVVGTTGVSDRTLILHGDGNDWGVVPGADLPGRAAGLRDVATAGGRAVWAVGWTVGEDGVYQTLVERWDGARWGVVPGPDRSGDAVMSGVASVDGDVWVVGWSWEGDETTPIVRRRDGRTWQPVALPGSNGAHAQPASITAVPGGGVVIVGRAADDAGILRPVAFRSDGDSWIEVDLADAELSGGFAGVTGLREQGWLSVGSATESEGGYTFLAARGC